MRRALDSVAAATGVEGRLAESDAAPGDPPPRRRCEQVCAPRVRRCPASSSCVALTDACLLRSWGVLTRVSRKNKVDGASRHGDESDGGRNLGEKQALASPRLRLRHRDHRVRALLERPRAESRGEGARVECELAAGVTSPQVGVEQEDLELRELVVQARRHPATRVLSEVTGDAESSGPRGVSDVESDKQLRRYLARIAPRQRRSRHATTSAYGF